uniref:Uncharacterized protein n=1 Tax=viral metagenome TaxID=1070528 RepID=A0A6H1ZR57_9ZZZZ
MTAIITYNGGWILDDDAPAGPGGNAIQDTLKRLLTVIDCTNFGTGTISLGAYNYTIGAANTFDGRDVSVDGTKLDGIEAAADVTDAVNVAAAGAAMAGGAFHDGFSDFVAYEHTSWVTGTGCVQHFATSGFGAFGNSTVNSAYRLLVERTTVDVNAKYGLHIDFTPGATVAGAYHTRALSFNCAPYAETGITNSGGTSAVRGEVLGAAAHLGTLSYMFGMNFIVGHNTGASGTTTEVAGVRVSPYQKAGTITTFYGISIESPTTGGTVTNKWGLYDATGWPSYHAGNLGIGSTTLPTAGATKVLFFGDNAAQPTMGANTAGAYGYDPGTGTVELWAVDDLSNDTQLSSHPFSDQFAPDPKEPMPYALHHRNRLLGRGQYIDVSRMARLLEEQFGVKLVHDYDLPPEQVEDWDQVQADRKEQWERWELEKRIQAAVDASETEITEAEAVEEIEASKEEAVELVDVPARVVYRSELRGREIVIEIVPRLAKRELRVRPEYVFDETTGRFFNRRVRAGCEQVGDRWIKRLTYDEAKALVGRPTYAPKPLPAWIAERLAQRKG